MAASAAATVLGPDLAGTVRVIGVDVDEHKPVTAYGLGATHTVRSCETDAVDAVRELTGGFGVDVVIEAVGRPESYGQDCYARDVAGTVVLVCVATRR